MTASVLAGTRLAPRDAAFARAIAAASLRRFGQLEALIRHCVPKSPPPHKAGPTLEILITGACELLFLGVPAHAAVDGANRLAAADGKAVHFKSLINAVLRRIAREGEALLAAQDPHLNVPDWLWRRWASHYGEERALAIAEAHLQIPPLDLTLKQDGPVTPVLGAQVLAPGRLRMTDAGRIEDLAGFAEGFWWVQDFASSLPVRLFGDVKGMTIIDLCAAPGGKTLQLSALGAQVTALDISPERLKLIRENLTRTKLDARTIAADARDWAPETPADGVLLDAPCTASGTIRRHPDLPWLKTEADLQACIGLQSELLEHAASMTKPGGLLVYAVCSLEPEECEEQTARFLSRFQAFKREPVTPAEIYDPAFLSPEGDLRTLPYYWREKGGLDGFYAARLRRLF